MKTKISILLFVFLLAGFCAQISFAQAQEQKPQLYMVYDVMTKPSTALKYEAATKEEWALWAEAKIPYQWNAYSSDDFHYYFISPLKNYAAIDTMYKSYEELEKKIPMERWLAFEKSSAGTLEYYRIGLIYLRPDLSYAPAKPRLKPEEVNFIYWAFLYVENGKEKEFEDISKQWAALYKSKNIPLGVTTYVGDMGTDMPFYFWSMSGKSAVDFFSEDEKASKKIGVEKIMELWNKTMALLRKYEFKTGRPRPDLSYIPK